MGVKSWRAKLSKDTYIGVGHPSEYIGVPDGSGPHSKVTVVGHWHGVTLAFDRSNGKDHLCIYLEPADARAIGKELIKKASVVDGIHVIARLKGG